MLVKVFASAISGINATTVVIEAQASRGAKFMLVGLPDTVVKESHQRVVTAIKQSGYPYPVMRYVINMAPADIKKEGAAYDLPLAIAILASTEVIPADRLGSTLIMGELSLDGSIQPVQGVLPMAMTARKEGFESIIVPADNAREAAIVDGLRVYGATCLADVVAFFSGEGDRLSLYPHDCAVLDDRTLFSLLNFAEVKGQAAVKRAMEIAAAGMHNMIMVGPPGSGKSMMAKRLPTILPPFAPDEALETTMIHSVAGTLPADTALMRERPFRSPHHSTSNVAMVGGGSYPKPGEISLAHNGVLFLDELPEFGRNVLEVLRQPLEDRTITISRAKMTTTFPASFMLVASMNPCPCGHYNNPQKACRCTPHQVTSYLNRISGPLLDRIDLQVEIVPVPFDALADTTPTESSSVIRERVRAAREIQRERFKDYPHIYSNAQMPPALIKDFVRVDKAGLDRLRVAMDRFALSARAYDRILKVSRTIADLSGSTDVTAAHIGEAVGYRKLDRESWGQFG
ncbi:YifB family Mg chelatase-like AAA ATPase [Porphyromonas sp.]|uniref:YifB family Mg chelatase-like AAA ATPase n=1 Tax=Porphyromonas sp. TaxID=1924944 RepID=UPI0026DBB9E4|nr:YifB family Mg chelatase-like AAA ATPase [Porphyromonas sp.]MDO4771319.1 YifB family Mg chelatase-like AAA ATPase [Porphyromonas sp.]